MKKTILVALLLVSSITFAQKLKVKSGDFKILKGQKEVNVEFDYSNLKLMKDNITEDKYVTDRVAELNAKNKGNGDIWKKKWESSKELIWSPKFLELMNVIMTKSKKDISFQEGKKEAKYTLVVDVVWLYPGWDIAMMKQKAKVTTVIRLVETANRSKVLAEVTSDEAPGDQWGNNFSNESRLGEGFAKTGKSIAQLISKSL